MTKFLLGVAVGYVFSEIIDELIGKVSSANGKVSDVVDNMSDAVDNMSDAVEDSKPPINSSTSTKGPIA